MVKRARTPDEFDGPWKNALQLYLQAFLEFFFPDIGADIDWQRGYESLDKEMQKIARRAKIGKLLADKLFKVCLKDGSEHWLLIHIEIQGEYDKDLAERMFRYNVAAYQMYNKSVISLAALCDDRAEWRPTTFRYGMWGCKAELIFRIAKLLDYGNDVAGLEASDNPFAAVVLANCKAIETRHDPANRKVWKLRVIKGLYGRNWTKDQILLLFVMIDSMMGLPKDLAKAFDAELADFEEERKVRYVTSIERHGIQKGLEKGREEGRKAAVESIGLALDAKFGSSSIELMPKVRRVSSLAKLRKLVRSLKKADTLDEVREYLG
jgi:Putative transposase, YhgA-like